jgi:hypothetical protein
MSLVPVEAPAMRTTAAGKTLEFGETFLRIYISAPSQCGAK